PERGRPFPLARRVPVTAARAQRRSLDETCRGRTLRLLRRRRSRAVRFARGFVQGARCAVCDERSGVVGLAKANGSGRPKYFLPNRRFRCRPSGRLHMLRAVLLSTTLMLGQTGGARLGPPVAVDELPPPPRMPETAASPAPAPAPAHAEGYGSPSRGTPPARPAAPAP